MDSIASEQYTVSIVERAFLFLFVASFFCEWECDKWLCASWELYVNILYMLFSSLFFLFIYKNAQSDNQRRCQFIALISFALLCFQKWMYRVYTFVRWTFISATVMAMMVVVVFGRHEWVCESVCLCMCAISHRKPTLKNDMDIDFVWFNQQ